MPEETHLNKYFLLYLQRLSLILIKKGIDITFSFDQGALSISYKSIDHNRLMDAMSDFYKISAKYMPKPIAESKLIYFFNNNYNGFIENKFIPDLKAKNLKSIISNTNIFFPNKKKQLIMREIFFNPKMWILYKNENENLKHLKPFQHAKPIHNPAELFLKGDLLLTKTVNSPGNKFLLFLMSIDPVQNDRFYDASLILSYLFDPGGRLSVYQTKLKNKKKIELNNGFYKFKNVSKKLIYVNKKFYYLITLRFKKKYQKLSKLDLCAAILANMAYELQNINQSIEELDRIKNQAVFNLHYTYDHYVINNYLALNHLSHKEYLGMISLIDYYDKGELLRIASRFVNEESILIISHPKINRKFYR